jgi:hypothetical protein
METTSKNVFDVLVLVEIDSPLVTSEMRYFSKIWQKVWPLKFDNLTIESREILWSTGSRRRIYIYIYNNQGWLKLETKINENQWKIVETIFTSFKRSILTCPDCVMQLLEIFAYRKIFGKEITSLLRWYHIHFR